MDNLFGAGGGGGGPEQWFLSLPPVTRALLGSTLAVTAMDNLDVVKWHDLDIGWEDVVGRVGGRAEAWRLLTCFLYAGKFGLNAIISLHLMTQISSRYERMGPICTRRMHINPQYQNPGGGADGNAQRPNNAQRMGNGSPYYPRGETSDYVFALLFGMVGIIASHILLIPKLPAFITNNRIHRFFHRHLTFYVVYIWSKQHPERRVNLFGINLSAAYLPFAYLVIGYAMNNQMIPVDILHGMFVGHIYYYLACVVPQVLGRRRAILSTPIALVDLCNWLEGRGRIPIRNEGGAGDDGPMLVDVDGVIGG